MSPSSPLSSVSDSLSSLSVSLHVVVVSPTLDSEDAIEIAAKSHKTISHKPVKIKLACD